MTKTPQWQVIREIGANMQTHMLSVNGGNIYRFVDANYNVHCIFVADKAMEGSDFFNKFNELTKIVFAEIDSLRNSVGELSFKINKVQSDLREFEKQHFEPLKKYLEVIKNNAQKNYEIVRDKQHRQGDLIDLITDNIEKLKEEIKNLDEYLDGIKEIKADNE